MLSSKILSISDGSSTLQGRTTGSILNYKIKFTNMNF